MTYAAAARYMGKSSEFVRKWVKRYKETKTVDDLLERGSQRATTKREDKVIVKIFEKNPACSLRLAQQTVAKKGIEVSMKTIERRLFESGYKWRGTILKPFLKPKHVQDRL